VIRRLLQERGAGTLESTRRRFDIGPLAASALRARGLVERGPQSLGELHGVVVGPEVHEDETGLLGEHVAVDRRHLDAVLPQRLDHRVHLFPCQHEVAGDGGLAAAGRLEADGRCHTGGSGGRELHSVLGDRIAARHRELIDAAIGLPLDADDLIELGGVEIDRRRRGRGRRRCQRRLALRQK
jgi:hypothetical protein